MIYVLSIYAGLVALAAMLWLASWILHRISRGRDGMARDRFIASQIEDRLDIFGASDELELRQEMARLRVVASDRVKANPSEWIAILDEEKAEAVKRLMPRRDLARRFGDAVRHLPYTHILYSDAARAAERTIPAFHPRPTNDIDRAALRIVNPS